MVAAVGGITKGIAFVFCTSSRFRDGLPAIAGAQQSLYRSNDDGYYVELGHMRSFPSGLTTLHHEVVYNGINTFVIVYSADNTESTLYDSQLHDIGVFETYTTTKSPFETLASMANLSFLFHEVC